MASRLTSAKAGGLPAAAEPREAMAAAAMAAALGAPAAAGAPAGVVVPAAVAGRVGAVDAGALGAGVGADAGAAAGAAADEPEAALAAAADLSAACGALGFWAQATSRVASAAAIQGLRARSSCWGKSGESAPVCDRARCRFFIRVLRRGRPFVYLTPSQGKATMVHSTTQGLVDAGHQRLYQLGVHAGKAAVAHAQQVVAWARHANHRLN
ncbi:MAG: hypothetical protein FJY26_01990 [Betaproteobacteria bacterium]|nr:hypothetical protein [Betaproteobacteria bacterium]